MRPRDILARCRAVGHDELSEYLIGRALRER